MKKLTILCAALAVLCLLYGLLVAMVHSGSRFYMVWMGIGIALLILAAGWEKGLFLLLPRGIQIAIPVFLSAGILVIGLICVLIVHCFMTAGTEKNVDYLLVLGAQVRQDGPSKVLRYRLDAAADYLKNHPETLCILSGGQGYNEPVTEAEGMRSYLLEKGIEADRLILEDKSENTLENIRNSMALLPGDASAAIVTNNFHLFRALHIAEKQGMKNVSGIAAYSEAFYMPSNIFRESLGVCKDLIRGNM